MSDDASANIATFLTFVLVVLVIYFVFHKLRPDSTSGILTSGSEQDYGYVYGDNLYSYPAYGYFNGIDVRLPVQMPHIYLDSLLAGGNKVSAVFDVSQRLDLEGDFPKYFNVFVPNKYEVIALSILTPDVMETLQKYASRYDVEIYGDHLRIISGSKVLKDSGQFAAMTEVAQKIIKEVEDRMRGWTMADTIASIGQDLHVYPNRGVRIFGRYVTWMRIWLSIWWFMCTAMLLVFGLWLLVARSLKYGLLVLGSVVVVYILLQLYSRHTQSSGRFWSRRG